MSNQIINPIFIGHGSPINAISSNSYTNFLKSYAKNIITPKAILVISAHWLTKGTFISSSNNPKQIYDFYGFPEELYKVIYSPSGDKNLATNISASIPDIQLDDNRGIDHAGWAVVKHMYPNQNIPVLELSLDINKSVNQHYELGKELGILSEQGILLLGSGNVVHNLRDIDFEDTGKTFSWAVEADKWIKEKIEENEIQQLIDYKKYLPGYSRAIPTDEHYLPFLYILGMKKENNKVNTVYEEIQNGSISMRSIEIQ